MVKKIQITLGNKTFYALIVIAAILAISGVAYAFNPNLDINNKSSWSGNPAVMGHSVDEIQDLDNYITATVFGSGDCSNPTLVFNSTAINPNRMAEYQYDSGKKNVDASCIGSSCMIKQEIYNQATHTLKLVRIYSYYQDSNTGIWSSTTSATGKKNGDAISSDIVPKYGSDSGYLYIRDDYYRSSYTNETSSSQWLFVDRTNSYDMNVYVCSNNADI